MWVYVCGCKYGFAPHTFINSSTPTPSPSHPYPQLCTHLAVFPIEFVGSLVPDIARLLDLLLLEEQVEVMGGHESASGLTVMVKQRVAQCMVGCGGGGGVDGGCVLW